MHESKTEDGRGMASEKQTRRQFCGRLASVAALGGALGTILEGCGGSPTGPGTFSPLPVVTGNTVGTATTVSIDASSPLSAVGGAALVNAGSNLFLVAHTAADTFVALGAICTHQRCIITGYSGQDYVCPCHGSQYAFTGQVLSGPAPFSLPTYPTQYAAGVLTISA